MQSRDRTRQPEPSFLSPRPLFATLSQRWHRVCRAVPGVEHSRSVPPHWRGQWFGVRASGSDIIGDSSSEDLSLYCLYGLPIDR